MDNQVGIFVHWDDKTDLGVLPRTPRSVFWTPFGKYNPLTWRSSSGLQIDACLPWDRIEPNGGIHLDERLPIPLVGKAPLKLFTVNVLEMSIAK